MITLSQLEQLSRKFRTSLTVVGREYLQLIFLQNFYEIPESKNVYFKGGTAIHVLMDGFRFSEDLDFTCETSHEGITLLLSKTVEKVQQIISGVSIKEKKTISGKSYLLTQAKEILDFSLFVRLDFSFREKVLQKEKHLIKSEFPVIFSSFTHHMGAEEILAEKIRAIITRRKGRDLFDLWFLLKKGYKFNEKYIEQKMNYYPKISFSWKEVSEVIKQFNYLDFKSDIIPFLSIDKRAKIEETFEIIKMELSKEIEPKIQSQN